jgi:dihydropyrimidinase
VPTGLPGIGARLPVGFALGGDDPLGPQRLVEVACANPARIFGLYPRKGVVAEGADADLVVWDPSQRGRLTLESIDDALDWTPYEGLAVPGSVRHVVAGGELAVHDGDLVAPDHRGQYLPIPRVRDRTLRA